jgi:hypothetical protein
MVWLGLGEGLAEALRGVLAEDVDEELDEKLDEALDDGTGSPEAVGVATVISFSSELAAFVVADIQTVVVTVTPSHRTSTSFPWPRPTLFGSAKVVEKSAKGATSTKNEDNILLPGVKTQGGKDREKTKHQVRASPASYKDTATTNVPV